MDPIAWGELLVVAQWFATYAVIGVFGSGARLLDPRRKIELCWTWRLMARGALVGGFAGFGVADLALGRQVLVVAFVAYGAEVVLKVAEESMLPIANSVSRWLTRRTGKENGRGDGV